MKKLPKKINDTIKKTYRKARYVKNPTCYFYDLEEVTNNINNLKATMPEQIDLYYAMKANNNDDIMKCVFDNPYCYGVEITSSGELFQALKYRSSDKIIFTGPGKTGYELEQAVINKIKFINVESIVEAIRVNQYAIKHNISNVDVLVRINLNYSITDATEHMTGCSTKMGIDENDSIKAIKYISDNLERITVRGIHVFAASGVMNYDSLIKSNEYIFKLVHKIERRACKIDSIDFGGGLGIDYTNQNRLFDVENYGIKLSKLIKKYKFEDKRILMELGTYIVGNAGYYTAKIIDIKMVKGKKHIIVAGGVNHMGLPLEMRRKHPVAVVEMKEKKLYDKQPFVYKERVDISGPLCMVSDKLCWNTFVDKAEIGDIMVFLQAGAYCYGEGMHKFLSHFLPDEISIL